MLLFGDSFAMCVEKVDCFEDILNADTSFTNKFYLMNYGIGGYGVDIPIKVKAKDKYNSSEFVIANDGHPTTLLNNLISNSLKDIIVTPQKRDSIFDAHGSFMKRYIQ